ncbi:MAG: PEP-CTERM sorting domain-containing protein [Armatimonadetes bacterium]|nr:PEP-CTERM sorting domain-containing protein [Armatimonadota bacterium]
MKSMKLMALATALTGATVASNAQIVDFEDLLNNGTSGVTFYGDNVDSGGYNFASLLHAGDEIAIASWTADDPFGYYTGSTAIFANYYDDGLMMTEIGGGPFDVLAIDMADVFLSGTGDLVTFTGIHSDLGVTVNVIPLTDGSTLETYALTGMTDLISLEIIDGVNNDVQIDNLNTVPEPAAVTGLAVGLVALAFRRRRR